MILLCELGLFNAFRSIIRKAREIRLYGNNSLRLTKYDDGLDKTIIRLMFSGISGNMSCIGIKLLIT